MAAGGNSDNIELGPGRLYVAPLGTSEPATNHAALPSAWIAVGYTEDGTTVTIANTSAEVEVAEELDPVRYVNTKRTTKVAFAMAEMTRKNLALALAMGVEANDASYLEPPDSGTDEAVMIIWDSAESPTDADNTRWLFRQAKASGNIAISRKKSPNKATIPVEFNLEKPASAAAWKVYGQPDSLV